MHSRSIRSISNHTVDASDRINIAHYRHRVRAEVLSDAIADFTETSPHASHASESRITSLDDSCQFGVSRYGRPNENQDPPCEPPARR